MVEGVEWRNPCTRVAPPDGPSACTDEISGKFCMSLGPVSPSPASFGGGAFESAPRRMPRPPLSWIALPRIVTVSEGLETTTPCLELPEIRLPASGDRPPIVAEVGPMPSMEMPDSLATGDTAFLSRPMMLPWMRRLEPPLKLLLASIPWKLPEMRLRSVGFSPPIVAPTVPPWGKAASTPALVFGNAVSPAPSVPRKLPATTMPATLEPKRLPSWMASAQRLTMRPRITTLLARTVMQRFGALVPSSSICSTVFSAPVTFVFCTLPGCV